MKNINYRPEIDGLRAISILLVLFFHFELTINDQILFKGGYIGVDIFFVISGYLITKILLNEYKLTKTISFTGFYKRRARRILPAICFLLLITAPISYLLSPITAEEISKTLISIILFVSNYFFFTQSLEYFNFNLTNPYLHFWSLAVEEQFYLFFPIFFLFLLKYFKSHKKIIKIFFYIIFFNILFIHIIGNFKIEEPFIEQNFSLFKESLVTNFFLPTTRVWELICGSLVVFIERNNIKFNTPSIFSFFAILIILLSGILFDKNTMHPSGITLIPIMAVMLLLYNNSKKNYAVKFLSNKLFVYIGLISYSLYLWHYVFLVFNRNIVNQLDIFFVVFLTFLISSLSYHFIEKPFRNKNNLFSTLAIFISLSLMVVFFMALMGLNNNNFFSKYDNILKTYEISSAEDVKKRNQLENTFLKNSENKFFKSNDKKKILVVGNSFGFDFFNYLKFNENLYPKYDLAYSPVRYKKSILTFFKNGLNCNSSKKFIYMNDVMKEYSDKNHQKICAADYFVISTQYKNVDKGTLKIILDIIRKMDKKLIIITEQPFFRMYGRFSILENFIINNQRFPKINEIDTLEKKYYKSKNSRSSQLKINKMLETFANENKVKILKIDTIFCSNSEKKCKILNNNKPIHYDYGHVNVDNYKYIGKKIFDSKWFKLK